MNAATRKGVDVMNRPDGTTIEVTESTVRLARALVHDGARRGVPEQDARILALASAHLPEDAVAS